MAYSVGGFVGIQCEVKPGPFAEEMLVTVDTIDGAISGFVKRTELREMNGKWQVRGKVRRIAENALEVWILGSFFTTNGIANVSPKLAMAA